MGKFLKWLVLLGVLGIAGWFAFKWLEARYNGEEALAFVPPDAIYCIATKDPIKSWKEIAGSQAWAHLQKNSYFASLTASANSLDSLVRQNDLLFSLIGSRSLVASAHMTGPKQYDFLFVVDLAEASGIKFLQEYLTNFSAAGYSVKKEKYKKQDLITLHNPADNSNLFLSLPGTNLLVSYTKKIITAALDAQQAKKSLADQFPKTATVAMDDGGIVQLYVNYKRLPAFLGCYSSGTNEYVGQLSKTLLTSQLNLRVDHELISARGITTVNDSTESYIKTLAISGKGATDILDIAPQRTAFYIGFGFTSFQQFFGNFEKNLQQDVAQYKTYRANVKQVEDYLKIDLQKNFIAWIGDEIGLFELQSSGKGMDNEVALVLKADNIEVAKKELAFVEKMVRRKTPVKFKSIDHRGYKISYLSVKGLFKILLGKFFARYDKPYYTIINNYVIFSNHPQTLESIIDDYLDKKTLTHQADFRAFRKEFEDEGSIFVYLNTPVFFNTLKKLTDPATRTSMETNKEYIVCFRKVGFQLVPEAGRFKTLLAEQFEAPAEPVVLEARVPSMNEDSVHEANVVADEPEPKDLDPMALPYIYVQNLSAKVFTGYFPDSTVNFTVDLKNGFKNGMFTEYHPNGKVKMRGKFKDDQREGTWRLYDEEGKLVLRRNYQEDQVTKEKVKK